MAEFDVDAMTPETGGEEIRHPEILVNENPFSGSVNTVTEFLQAYGWFIVLAILVGLWLKNKLSPKLEKIRQKIETGREKKIDNETAQARLEAMEAARRRMQQQLDEQAQRHAEKMKEKEEEKRQQKIQEWDDHLQGKGYRNKHKIKEAEEAPKTIIKKSKNTLRKPDYNPLMGDGASCSWRPGGNRGGARGGG